MALWILPPIGAIIGSTLYSESPDELPIVNVTYIEVSGQTLSTSGNKTLTLYDPIIITKATYGWNDKLNIYDISKKLQFLIKEKSGTIEFEISKVFGELPFYSKTKASLGALMGLFVAIMISRVERLSYKGPVKKNDVKNTI